MERRMSGASRAGWLLALVAMAGCELVVDFDRDRIVDDAGIDMAMEGDDMGMPPEEDMGPEADMGPEGDMGPEADMFAETDMFEGDAFMCTGAGDCDDSVDCTVDECTGGACSNTATDAMCDDTNACTADSCDAITGCDNTSICSLDVNAGAITMDLTTVLTVPEVEAGADGFLVVYDSTGTTVFGSAAVSAGTSTDVDVPLDRQLGDTDMVVVRLHEDIGTIGTFEDGTDPVAEDGAAIQGNVTVTIPAGTPDIEVTISGDNTDYTFSMARSSAFAPTATLTGADPAITLIRGLRYRFVNTSPGSHPLEFITDGGGGADTVQLAQGTDVGALEGDAEIDWTDAGMAVEATVDTDFEAAIDGYRCGIHTTMMRAAISYDDL